MVYRLDDPKNPFRVEYARKQLEELTVMIHLSNGDIGYPGIPTLELIKDGPNTRLEKYHTLDIIAKGEYEQEIYSKKIIVNILPDTPEKIAAREINIIPEDISLQKIALIKIPAGPYCWFEINSLYEDHKKEMDCLGVVKVDGIGDEGIIHVYITERLDKVKEKSHQIAKFVLERLGKYERINMNDHYRVCEKEYQNETWYQDSLLTKYSEFMKRTFEEIESYQW
jgi:hypothetical protein